MEKDGVFMLDKLRTCPVETTLLLINNRWKILILRELLDGTKRFGELRKAIGTVSPKVLTSHLRSMEKDGLVEREIFAEVPPRVEYTLTELGESLKPILDTMKDWGINYQEKVTIEVDHSKLDDQV